MRIARWILARLAPAEWRESLDGDLSEERLRRLANGQKADWTWSVPAALSVALVLRREARAARLRGPRRFTVGEGLLQDVRLSVRSLRAAPGFTLVALVVLALGIGASTAIFTVVDTVLLRRLPYEDSDRLVIVGENNPMRPSEPWAAGVAAAPNYLEWSRHQTVFESMAAVAGARGFVIRDGGEPEDLRAIRATASLFDVLRIRPQRGRAFTRENETDSTDKVLLISDSLWRQRFDSDPGIVGRTMVFESGTWQIIGVLPASFSYPANSRTPMDIIAPYVVPERQRSHNDLGRNYTLRVIARLREGVTLTQARGEMTRLTSALAARYPSWFADHAAVVVPMHDVMVGRARSWMLMLLGAVGCVLLIACANVANLMLARGTTRAREIMLRAALGASRWRIVRALLAESVVLSAAGLVAGVVVALWGISALRASIPATIPRLGAMALDLRVLVVAAAAALTTGLICGLVPALQLSRPDLQWALREGGRSGTPNRFRQRLRAGLVVAEVALAVVLVVGAGLFTSSFARLITVELGLDHRDVIATSVNPDVASLDEAGLAAARARTTHIVADVLDRVRAIPGVVSAAAVAGGLPLSGSSKTTSLTVDGFEFTRDEDQIEVQEVTPGYFDVVRQPLRRGRTIEPRDGPGAPHVAVLNEEAVKRYFGGQEALGRRITVGETESVVVGVVGDVRLRGPEDSRNPAVYFALAQDPSIGASVVARVTDRSGTAAAAIRAAVLQSLPGKPVFQRSMEESLRAMTEQRRFNMVLVGVFGVLALVIASVGIFGVMAYTVAQQTREIGVRMALGAMPQRVLAMVLGRAAIVMVAGLAIGLTAAWALAGTVQGFLFSVTPHDPAVFTASTAVLLLTGLIAALVPALRAARVDPIVALRSE
jgi:putative ABC transport system permease protein